MSEDAKELTQEEALRLADALAGQALKATEARCAVLAQFIHDCDRAGSSGAASAAARELSALHARRRALIHRRSLIQQALDCPVGETPPKAPLAPPPDQPVRQPQRQIQLRARRRA